MQGAYDPEGETALTTKPRRRLYGRCKPDYTHIRIWVDANSVALNPRSWGYLSTKFHSLLLQLGFEEVILTELR